MPNVVFISDVIVCLIIAKKPGLGWETAGWLVSLVAGIESQLSTLLPPTPSSQYEYFSSRHSVFSHPFGPFLRSLVFWGILRSIPNAIGPSMGQG
jgi:hypothetical protein